MLRFTQNFIDSLTNNKDKVVCLNENLTPTEAKKVLGSRNKATLLEEIVSEITLNNPLLTGCYMALRRYCLPNDYCCILKKDFANIRLGSKSKTERTLFRAHKNLVSHDIAHIYRLPNDYIAYFFIHDPNYDPQVEEEFSQLKGVKKVRKMQ